jgi:hypothetical protein
MPDGELVIPVGLHPSGVWVGISVTIASRHTIFMVLDTGAPASGLSPSVSQDLQRRGLLHPSQVADRFLLTELTAEAAEHKPPLPDLLVGTVLRLGRLQIEGLLGLDFFRLFDHICFDFPTSSLTVSPIPTR